MTGPGETPWWDRDRHTDRRGFLIARNTIKQALRGWFACHEFTEVECAQLQVSPGNEVHLHGYETRRLAPDGSGQTLYLHTSPEFACKKLLAAGETRIFDFARVFRNREADSPLHAHEFTMLEWYRTGAGWRIGADDALALMAASADALEATHWRWQGRSVAVDAAPVWISLAEAFDTWAGIDLAGCLTPDGRGDRDAFALAIARAGLAAPAEATWGDLFTDALVARVEPALAAIEAPVVLHDYPRPEAALARACQGDPRFAERFELYVCGVELANGFGELIDPVEQRARFEAAMAEQARLFGSALPLDEDLLSALALMPDASGVALGFERLVMLTTGARHIDQVRWTL
ncbi:MAG: EF-P lysine aminoacylase EpmA [Hyphomonadaceae bacterium]|jgi:lysyl-tRNA synthetase class 2|nr:EF-P lysine aminoacylase EpmA [Hyphomonadaceae bacterium]